MITGKRSVAPAATTTNKMPSKAATSGVTSISLTVGGETIRARLTRASVEELGLQPGADVYALIKTAGLDSD